MVCMDSKTVNKMKGKDKIRDNEKFERESARRMQKMREWDYFMMRHVKQIIRKKEPTFIRKLVGLSSSMNFYV